MPVICLGILWCQADDFYRAQILFELLNPPSKIKQNIVTTSDPEWDIVFTCIVEIATITIVQMADPKKSIDVTLRRRAISAMRLSANDQNEDLTGMIMLLYGY